MENRGPEDAESSCFKHVVQFYHDDDVVCRAVADFFLEGSDLGDYLVLLATDARRRAVGRRLAAAGFDFEGACGNGSAVFAEAATVLDRVLVDGRPDPDRFDAVMRGLITPPADGSRPSRRGRTRVFGELVDILARGDDAEGALRLEDMWTDLARTRDFSLFCAYHRGNLFREVNGSAYREVSARHSRVIPAES